MREEIDDLIAAAYAHASYTGDNDEWDRVAAGERAIRGLLEDHERLVSESRATKREETQPHGTSD